MNGNIEERADALIDQNIVCETQDQMRKSGAEYVQEHGSGHTHSHIDENGNVTGAWIRAYAQPYR